MENGDIGSQQSVVIRVLAVNSAGPIRRVKLIYTTSVSMNKAHIYFKIKCNQKFKQQNLDYITRN
jgi:hypothetical protein